MNTKCSCGKAMYRTSSDATNFITKVATWKCSHCGSLRTQRLRKGKDWIKLTLTAKPTPYSTSTVAFYD